MNTTVTECLVTNTSQFMFYSSNGSLCRTNYFEMKAHFDESHVFIISKKILFIIVFVMLGLGFIMLTTAVYDWLSIRIEYKKKMKKMAFVDYLKSEREEPLPKSIIKNNCKFKFRPKNEKTEEKHEETLDSHQETSYYSDADSFYQTPPNNKLASFSHTYQNVSI